MADKPKFTVHDGGKPPGGGEPPDYNTPNARYRLRKLAVEIMRAVARGDDPTGRVYDELQALSVHLSKSQATIDEVFGATFREMNEEIEPRGDDYDGEIGAILAAALQVAAERSAEDPAARGRASKREERLRFVIEQFILGREERSRKNAGSSYLGKLLKQNFPPRPKRSKWDDDI
jgi:hypothetical protein